MPSTRPTKLVYCAGEQARVVLDILRAAGTEKVVLLDDDVSKHGDVVGGVEVRGGRDRLDAFDPAADEAIVAFGSDPGVRLDIASDLRDAGFEFFSAVHPDSTVSGLAELGTGVMLNARTYVGPGASVGDHVLLDSLVNVSHDVTLGDGATVTPGAALSGGVTVGRDAYVGANATVSDHVTVGERAVVGAGAVVIDDVPPGTTVVGNPAAPLE